MKVVGNLTCILIMITSKLRVLSNVSSLIIFYLFSSNNNKNGNKLAWVMSHNAISLWHNEYPSYTKQIK